MLTPDRRQDRPVSSDEPSEPACSVPHWQIARAARKLENPLPPRQIDIDRVIADNPHVLDKLEWAASNDLKAAVYVLFDRGIWDLDANGRIVMTEKGYILSSLMKSISYQPGSGPAIAKNAASAPRSTP